MGRAFLRPDEVKLKKCPYCGSDRLVLYEERLVSVREVVSAKTGETLSETVDEVIDEIVVGVECDGCGEDLSEECGF